MAIDFNNTEVAFKGKSTFQLAKAYWLFKIVSSKPMVSLGGVFTKTALTLHLPINYPIKKPFLNSFVGENTLRNAMLRLKNWGRLI